MSDAFEQSQFDEGIDGVADDAVYGWVVDGGRVVGGAVVGAGVVGGAVVAGAVVGGEVVTGVDPPAGRMFTCAVYGLEPDPAFTAMRLAKVPTPSETALVSPVTTSTHSIGMLSSSAHN